MATEPPPVRAEGAPGVIGSIRLRPTAPADLPALYALQSDPEANRLAGTKPRTREAFFANWERIFADPRVNSRIIEVDGQLIGGVSVFQAPPEGRATPSPRAPAPPGAAATDAPAAAAGAMRDCLGYWIARSHWGRGITSRAVAMFLAGEPRRPLHATAARANTASIRILERCGFRCTGYRMGEETDRYIACEIADFILD
jgi:RimJ/RimL family protein N-acetyltransferase